MKPYLVGIVLDTVFPIMRGTDWQIKIALFQSEKSFGYAQIKGHSLDELPKGLKMFNLLRNSTGSLQTMEHTMKHMTHMV